MDQIINIGIFSYVIIAIILSIIILIAKKKGKIVTTTNYFLIFIIGAMSLLISIPIKRYDLLVFGIVFIIMGLINRDKWKKKGKLKTVLMIILGIILFLGLFLYLMGIDSGSIK